MTQISSRLVSKPTLCGAVAFVASYYASIIMLWVAGLKGFPKPTVFQLVNSSLVFLVGYFGLPLIARSKNPYLTAAAVAILASGLRLAAMLLADGLSPESISLSLLWRRNGVEFFTFTAIALATVLGGLRWMQRCERLKAS